MFISYYAYFVGWNVNWYIVFIVFFITVSGDQLQQNLPSFGFLGYGSYERKFIFHMFILYTLDF